MDIKDINRDAVRKTASQYAWANSNIIMSKTTYWPLSEEHPAPVEDLVAIPIADRIDTAVQFGIMYALQHIDEFTKKTNNDTI